MIYLAQPYSSPDREVRQSRFLKGMAVASLLLSQGKHVYSPITHWHVASETFSLPGDFAFWQEHNFYMLDRSSAIYCLLLEGWPASKGLRGELEHWINSHGGKKPVNLFTVSLLELPYNSELRRVELPTIRVSPVQDAFALMRYFNGQDTAEPGTDAGSNGAPH